ncbi:MAG: hypothetical protein V3T05_13665 [Myxococcota bacterium]
MKQLNMFSTGRIVGKWECRTARPDPDRPAELAEWLTARLGRPVRLVFTNNRSTLLSYREEDDCIHVRLHRFFSNAEAPVVEALAQYLTDDDRAAGRVIDAFVAEQAERMQFEPRSVDPKGRFHDLEEILAELNRTYFHSACNVQITWGHAGRRGYRRSIQLGSYVSHEKLIRIHPCLDQAFVPRSYVAWVVFHEMLHETYGVERNRGRRSLHPPEFEALEESYPDYRECMQWEAENLHRLLKYRAPKRRGVARR